MTEPAVRRSLRTKIVCTLGPATSAPDRIRALILEGVDCFRINLSHGTEEEHAETIARVRAASREAGRPVPVLLDLRGAKIRTTESRPSPFELRTGAAVALAGGEKPSTEQRLHITPAIALENLEVGHRILIDDGKIELVVTHRRPAEWGCRVVTGGSVNDRRGVTLLEVPTPQLPGLTDKDVSDIAFGVRHGADLFALSFVRSAADVVAARKQIARCGAETPIIAKIEKPEAITELDRILEESYGVMVARGDLGVEAPLEKVPVYQKRIIARARKRCKPVITATQMLESMTDRPVPTRAEVSDVANAVFDGTDAVMLSAETSIGKYPLEAVRMMARAARAAEDALLETHRDRTFAAADRTFADALGAAAAVAAESIGARCILVFTASGYSAALIAQYRPRMPIHAFSGCAAVVAHLAVVWGVEARLLQPMPSGIEDLVHRCERALLESKQLAPGDPIAIVAGVPLEEQGNTNFLKLHRVGEGLGRGAAPAR